MIENNKLTVSKILGTIIVGIITTIVLLPILCIKLIKIMPRVIKSYIKFINKVTRRVEVFFVRVKESLWKLTTGEYAKK